MIYHCIASSLTKRQSSSSSLPSQYHLSFMLLRTHHRIVISTNLLNNSNTDRWLCLWRMLP